MGTGDFRAEVWMAAFGTVAMPAEAAARLSAEINTIVNQPDIRERLRRQGWQVVGGGPEDLRPSNVRRHGGVGGESSRGEVPME